MNTKFTIYTEDVKTSVLVQEVSVYFENFTIQFGVGYWKNNKETSAIVSIYTDVSKAQEVYTIAANIKELNKQDAVLVVQENVIARTI